MKQILKKLSVILLAGLLVLPFASCSGEKVLRVGASPPPHAEILNQAKPLLAERGITLEIEEFTDYVLPNMTLDSGELDANYFQHLPYLLDFNEKNGTDLVSAAAIHAEPLGIYPGRTASLDAIPDGAQIAVPNDTSNEARALLLLESLGLITVDPSKGLEATVLDITDNPKNIEIIEIEAAQLPRILPDVDLAVINGNYALGAGLTDQVLATESADSDGALEFANIIAVRAGDENREDIQALVEVLSSDEIAQFIQETYGSTVIPVANN